MNKQENYTIYRISKDIQRDPALLLLSAGTIMSQCYSYFLTLSSSVTTEFPGGSATQRFMKKAVISDAQGQIKNSLDAEGVPYQCAEYFVASFEEYLSGQNSELCHDIVREMTGDELIK